MGAAGRETIFRKVKSCPRCGYDLRGLLQPCTCPECGLSLDEGIVVIAGWNLRRLMPSRLEALSYVVWLGVWFPLSFVTGIVPYQHALWIGIGGGYILIAVWYAIRRSAAALRGGDVQLWIDRSFLAEQAAYGAWAKWPWRSIRSVTIEPMGAYAGAPIERLRTTRRWRLRIRPRLMRRLVQPPVHMRVQASPREAARLRRLIRTRIAEAHDQHAVER